MKLFIDNNVILDVLLERKPFFDASFKLLECKDRQDLLFFAASSATDIYYILRKSVDDFLAQIHLGKLFTILNCVDTQTNDILCALAYDMPDFEDGVIESMAFRIGANYIITRNTKDYKRSRIPALTPAEYLKMVKTSD